MGRKQRLNEGGPKRRMRIDMTQITREREEEAAEMAASEASNKEEKKGNPLMSLLGGEYEDDEQVTSKSTSSKSATTHSTSGSDVSDSAIDKQLDSFLQELGQITGENMNEKSKSEEVAQGGAQGEASTQGVWQACLDSESNDYYYWNTSTDEVTWEMPAEYQQQQKLPAQQTTTQPNSETKGATQKEIPETPNETKEITATQKESTKESDIQNGATARVKRDAEAQEQIEPTAKKAKMEVDESKTSTQGGPMSDVKPPILNPKESDEITALLEQHQSEMLSGDAHEESESAKLQVKLEASILAISGKFEAYDVETTQPLDTAMDSMEIDSEILIERRELTKLRIEFETRVTDWREGALHSTYLLLKLQVLSATLAKTKLKPGKFETWNLLPVGWTRLADPSGTDGVYFANIITNETSWIWPPEPQPLPTTPPSATSPSITSTSPPLSTTTPPSSIASASPTLSSTPTTIYASAPVRYTVSSDENPDAPPSSPPPPPPDSPPPPPPDSSTSSATAAKKKVNISSSAAKPAKMNSVFAKWASARTELVGKKIEEGEGEGEGEEEDVETVEQRKKVEIEQWRTEQLKTGESGTNNANFVPVAMDWRERVERARRIAAKPSPSSTSSSSSSSSTTPSATPPAPPAPPS